MEFIRGLQGLKPHHRGAAITIGSFDGIHLGHGALIARTCALAAHAGKPAIMLTFEPLPREYLSARATPPLDPPARLTDLRERWRVLTHSDLSAVCVLRFNDQLRSLSGDEFVNLLADRFAASTVVVGQDFRFGRGGAGSVALLQAAADAGRFALELVPSVCVDDIRVSSSGVRAALSGGNFRAARDLLGRPYSMRGRVVTGEKLGRRLGFPTANIRMRRHKLPFTGVFAVRVRGIDGNLARDAVASLGFRPTVAGTEPLLEVHVFDFSGWLYNRELEVEFVAKIRDEEKFDSLDTLVRYMRQDSIAARALLDKSHAPTGLVRGRESVADYKHTINLPETGFPMKADLAQREPKMLAAWEQNDLYGKLRGIAKGRPRFVLHDGPPYANGALHLGHAVNKVLKDIVVKSHTLDGYDSPYVPGWDCHGLPIEHAVEKKHGRVGAKISAKDFRAACRKFAQEQVDLQRAEFKRFGVLGDWNRPYLTMDPRFEAQQIRALGHIIRNGHLYKGAKPVHWCLDCRSALAEAEVEYEDKTSSAVDVEFRVVDNGELARRVGVNPDVLGAFPVSIPIWTTTPWTLPANEAVSLGPKIEYVLLWVSRNGMSELLVLANELLDACLARYGLGKGQVLVQFEGSVLEHLQLAHPFLPKHVPVIVGEHVTLEAGTGAVHTAPAHGQDDFIIGQKYSLPVDNPVMGDGRFREGTAFVAGLKVDEGGEVLIKELESRGRLLKHEQIRHSYPHCWRHHTPVIFRATPQWFISMDQKGLRANALRDIKKVQWTPGWGEQRIFGMIEKRPDWCLSRQRTWGVPIALFVNKQTQELHPRTAELIEQVAARVEKDGIDAWFEMDARELLGDDADTYEKVTDVMDVWADSGLTHECVHHTHPDDVKPPVDLYLEGSDQHRGWFHSSLLMSEALYARAPYKGVLTHGFTVDDKGRKMSKSLGNVILPQKVMSSLGADVMRLWIAATDYANEMGVSDEILKRISDSYRRMRNTVRFLLGNLAGFDPAADALPVGQMVAIDRWALARTAALHEEIVEAYRKYEYHLIYQKIHNFCVVDLGGFYLDILKDRLYTTPKQSVARRSAQTALYHVAESMVRWLAPILSFTSEEIWNFMPGKRGESVFFETWHTLPKVEPDAIDWNALIALKTAVGQELEKLRVAGTIGSPLDAEVEVFCKDEFLERFKSLGEELRFLLIVSNAQVKRVSNAAGPPVGAIKVAEVAKEGGLWIRVQATPAPKCERCWHHRPEVGSNAEHPTLCARCVDNVTGPGESRTYV